MTPQARRPTVQFPAAQQLVSGLLLPRHVAGHPALELCNTVAGWGEPRPHDYLEGYEHVVAMVRSLGLVTASQAAALRGQAHAEPTTSARVLDGVRRLRGDLYGVLTGSPEPDLDRLDGALRAAAAARRLESVTEHGRPRWGFLDQGLRLPLDVLGWQAHRLLDDDLRPVRSCPGSGCGWLFTDPRGQRRWCVMSLCGNRAKARRHSAKRRREP